MYSRDERLFQDWWLRDVSYSIWLYTLFLLLFPFFFSILHKKVREKRKEIRIKRLDVRNQMLILEFHFLSFPFPYSSLFNGEEIKGEERSVPEVVVSRVSHDQQVPQSSELLWKESSRHLNVGSSVSEPCCLTSGALLSVHLAAICLCFVLPGEVARGLDRNNSPRERTSPKEVNSTARRF